MPFWPVKKAGKYKINLDFSYCDDGSRHSKFY